MRACLRSERTILHIAERCLRGITVLTLTGLVAMAAFWLSGVQSASAASPSVCGGTAHITDTKGDGHHLNTDVLSAWFSEDETGLRVVIKSNFGDWKPAHDDSEGAGWVFLFRDGSNVRYVRLHAPFPWEGSPVYDYGTWSQSAGFTSQGITSGSTVDGPGGTVTIEVPAVMGLVKGDVLTETQVLTYDGSEPAGPHWVDRAPGGIAPAAGPYGADFVVGSCLPRDPDDPELTTAVQLDLVQSRKGRGAAPVSGGVLPARAWVKVELTVTAVNGGSSRTINLVTDKDGRFTADPVIGESTLFRATAKDSGIASRSLTVTMRSQLTLNLGRKVRSRGGKRSSIGRAFGRVDPVLPGKVLILPVNGIFPVARTTVKKNGTYSIRSTKIRRGRYEAVFIPDKSRAERATSKKARLK